MRNTINTTESLKIHTLIVFGDAIRSIDCSVVRMNVFVSSTGDRT